jgi:CubicO group peptidase (beta-lactamase class C family)
MIPIAMLLLSAAPTENDFNSAAVDALDFWRVPGAAVVIVQRGKVVWLAGVGTCQVRRDDPVTPDTLFALASCGKAFTTAALAMLVEDGKLSWDDRVGKRLPGFRLSDAEVTRKVTLRDLLSHRTGLASHDILWFYSPDTPGELVRKAATLPLSAPLGKKFQYQSVMYAAAGMAASHTAGMPWEKLIQKRLLVPLGMKHTVTDTESARKSDDLATPHQLDARGKAQPMPLYRLPAPTAAGSIYSSARDLAPFLNFQLTGKGPDGKQLVPLKRLRETHEPQIALEMLEYEKPLFPGMKKRGYAMGWVAYDYFGHQLVAHGGALAGHRCHITLVPEKGIGIAVLANLDQTPMCAALSMTLLDKLLGTKPLDWNKLNLASMKKKAELAKADAEKRAATRKKDTKPSLKFADYAGTYRHAAYGKLVIRHDDGSLTWHLRKWEGDVNHWQDNTFTLTGPTLLDAQAEFRIKGGRVRAVHVGGIMNVTFQRDER